MKTRLPIASMAIAFLVGVYAAIIAAYLAKLT